jgi:hypothetical protein
MSRAMQKRWRVWQQLIPRSARERKVKKYKVADVTALCMTRSRKVWASVSRAFRSRERRSRTLRIRHRAH